MTKQRKVLFGLTFAVLCIIFLFLQIQIVFSFRTTGVIYPIRSWILRTDTDGNFISELKNYSADISENVTAYRFDRGDVVSLKLNPRLNYQTTIKKGDTIGYLYSQLMEEKIQSLENLIAIERRILETGTSGQKTEIIENARQKLILAEQQFEIARKNFSRIRQLFEENLISLEEYENAESQLDQAKTNVNIARTHYNDVQTGLKPEEIKVITERIKAYENELEFLRQTRLNYILLSPLEGIVHTLQYSALQQNVYVSVADTTEFVLSAPVRIQFFPYLKEIQKISITIPGVSDTFEAIPFQISAQVEWIGGQQVVFVKGKVENAAEIPLKGLTVYCRFIGQKIPLKVYLKRTLEIYFI